MNDSDDNEEDVRDVSKAYTDQETEQRPRATQMARQKTTAEILKKLNQDPR